MWNTGRQDREPRETGSKLCYQYKLMLSIIIICILDILYISLGVLYT